MASAHAELGVGVGVGRMRWDFARGMMSEGTLALCSVALEGGEGSLETVPPPPPRCRALAMVTHSGGIGLGWGVLGCSI